LATSLRSASSVASFRASLPLFSAGRMHCSGFKPEEGCK
jgi:hypothetical protein